jgi:hypothetical protein
MNTPLPAKPRDTTSNFSVPGVDHWRPFLTFRQFEVTCFHARTVS